MNWERNDVWGNVRMSHPIWLWNDCGNWMWVITCENDWFVNYMIENEYVWIGKMYGLDYLYMYEVCEVMCVK